MLDILKALMTTIIHQASGDDILILLIYIDDILFTCNNHSLIKDAKAYLHCQLKVKDLCELKYFLGIKVLKSTHGILLNQSNYILDLIVNVGLGGSKPIFYSIGEESSSLLPNMISHSTIYMILFSVMFLVIKN